MFRNTFRRELNVTDNASAFYSSMHCQVHLPVGGIWKLNLLITCRLLQCSAGRGDDTDRSVGRIS